MNFEDYLKSKRIDPSAFEKAEPDLYQSWKHEFSAMHPNSFTVQKLNLINPIRRKYQLTVVELPPAPAPEAAAKPEVSTPLVKPAVPRPMIKPKPKIN